LRLQVEDPLQVVTSLQLQMEPPGTKPGTKPVVLLLSLEESEALLLVSRWETVADHQLIGVTQCLEGKHGVQATRQRPRDVQRNRKQK
jgi:hypothetical protein